MGQALWHLPNAGLWVRLEVGVFSIPIETSVDVEGPCLSCQLLIGDAVSRACGWGHPPWQSQKLSFFEPASDRLPSSSRSPLLRGVTTTSVVIARRDRQVPRADLAGFLLRGAPGGGVTYPDAASRNLPIRSARSTSPPHPFRSLSAFVLAVERAVLSEPGGNSHHFASEHSELRLDRFVPQTPRRVEDSCGVGDRHDIRHRPGTQGAGRELHRVDRLETLCPTGRADKPNHAVVKEAGSRSPST
jgi:hypothetical protein